MIELTKEANVLLIEGNELHDYEKIEVQTSKGFTHQYVPEDIASVEIYISKLVILRRADGGVRVYSDADLFFKSKTL